MNIGEINTYTEQNAKDRRLGFQKNSTWDTNLTAAENYEKGFWTYFVIQENGHPLLNSHSLASLKLYVKKENNQITTKIGDIILPETLRGQGIGHALLQDALQVSQKHGASKIWGDMEGSEKFWLSQGFTKTEESSGAVTISKNLAPLRQEKNNTHQQSYTTNNYQSSMNQQIEHQIELLTDAKNIMIQHSQSLQDLRQLFQNAMQNFESEELNHDYLAFLEEFQQAYNQALQTLTSFMEDEMVPGIDQKISYLEERV